MLCKRRKVTRAVLGLIFLSLATTVITSLIQSNEHHNFLSLKGFVSKDRCASPDNINEALPHFISSAEYLISQVRTAVSDNTANMTAVSHSINKVKERMQIQLSEVEHQLQENDVKLLMTQPVINNHSFTYKHNRVDACSEKAINFLLVVPSAPANHEKRQAVRKGSKGDYARNSSNNAILLFFLGRPSEEQNYTSLQTKIDQEVKDFGDIIQEDFEDVYINNRLKSVSMLRWISTYCSNAKYVIRSDDDINIKVSTVAAAIERTAKTLNNFIIGHKRVDDMPARKVKNKYYLAKNEFPNATFPPYLLGGLLGYPASTAKLLYETALRVKPIWLEDVYISGICASKVHIPILTDPGFEFKHRYMYSAI